MRDRLGTRVLLGGMRGLASWPLWLLRAWGGALGVLLWVLLARRRRVVAVNLRLCFPQLGLWGRRLLGLRVFVRFGQAWVDRAWLWHAPEAVLRRRLRVSGLEHLRPGTAQVLFAPHFVGLDAGWTALTLCSPLVLGTIYTNQANPAADAWIRAGRARWGQPRLWQRRDGVRPVVAALRRGEALYLLPDMNFGAEESVFVPFFGVPAATVPSLPRFARLGSAVVVPVLTELTRTGYHIQVLPHWTGYPTGNDLADTAHMNQCLAQWIEACPDQYYWVHQRFKTRPPGEASVYR